MILTAHRGESYIAPENTLTALQLAWDWGAVSVELDVHMSRDGKIMVSHDGNTMRTAGVDLEIKDTDSSELRKLDVGKWKDEKYAGEKMPFLEEALAQIPAGEARLLLEIKCGVDALPAIRDILDASGKRSQVIPISFGLDVVTESKKMMPDLETLLIRSCARDPQTGERVPYGPELIQTALDANLDGLNLQYHTMTQEYADAVRDAGLILWTWTSNDLEIAKAQIPFGAARFGTDRRRWMAEQLAGFDVK
ncbi:MAG: glycerophosphodiester phosphodiesterase family protein [Armatimonadota bacterium]|jgi:glycerophosphoryl diester phosphodiesterase